MTNKIIHPNDWAPALGYANGVLTEDGTLYTGGQIGWDKDKVFVSDEFVPQMRQALKNVSEIVEAAGGTVADVVRLTWFVTDKKAYLENQRAVGEAYREIFGRHFPAMSMLVVAGLVEDQALVEIEATAHLK
ncbi:MAG: RidA family protein [Planktomarina sp.]|nr:RidA family protein [Planktomarina sp.]|tara:strand:+ start:984 stop:1379 length:396 start_codon:yes stop_codon:yes gene_type:complete